MAQQIEKTVDNGDNTYSKVVVSGGSASGASSVVVGNAASGAADSGNPVKVGGVFVSVPASLGDGARSNLLVDSRGNLSTLVKGSTVTGVDGVLNTALTSVTAFSSGFAANAVMPLATVGYNFNGSTLDRPRGDTAGTYAVDAPSTAAAVSLTPNASAAVASANTLKGSAGNLYRLNVVAGASAGYIMVFDATAAPADGAVTPKWVMPIAANAGINQGFSPPMRMAVGCTVVFSTTGPFTKTASTTAFIGGTCV